MKIAIHGRKFSDSSKNYVQQVFNELIKYQVDVQISESFKDVLHEAGISFDSLNIYNKDTEIFDADFCFSLGGDGTFLETVAHVGDRQIPILGINFGRLGFLASVSPEKISRTFYQLMNGYYTLEDRTLVHADSEIELFDEGTNFALNEIAISKTDTSSMIIIHASINGEFLNSYWADGLMVATATGSSGYSLSCGGPLVVPQSTNLIITPICPHNLFVRPIVVPDDSVISLRVESRSNNFLVSMDSRAKIIGDVDATITIKKENFNARLVKIEGDDFFSTLRSKLGWGKDVRN